MWVWHVFGTPTSDRLERMGDGIARIIVEPERLIMLLLENIKVNDSPIKNDIRAVITGYSRGSEDFKIASPGTGRFAAPNYNFYRPLNQQRGRLWVTKRLNQRINMRNSRRCLPMIFKGKSYLEHIPNWRISSRSTHEVGGMISVLGRLFVSNVQISPLKNGDCFGPAFGGLSRYGGGVCRIGGSGSGHSSRKSPDNAPKGTNTGLSHLLTREREKFLTSDSHAALRRQIFMTNAISLIGALATWGGLFAGLWGYFNRRRWLTLIGAAGVVIGLCLYWVAVLVV